MNGYFSAILREEELERLFVDDFYLIAAYANRRRVIISPSKPNGSVSLTCESECFFNMLFQVSGLVLEVYEVKPPEEVTASRMHMHLLDEETEAFWLLLHQKWGTFSSYFYDCSWDWVGSRRDGLSLAVRAQDSGSLSLLGNLVKLGEYIVDNLPPGHKFQVFA